MRLSVSLLLLWVFATGNIDGYNLLQTSNQVRPHFPLVKVKIGWIVAMHYSCYKCSLIPNLLGNEASLHIIRYKC